MAVELSASEAHQLNIGRPITDRISRSGQIVVGVSGSYPTRLVCTSKSLRRLRMSATSFLRRACFPPSIFTRTFCQAHINRSPLAKHAVVKPYVAGIRIHLNRHSSVVPARAILSVSDAPRPPSILKLIPSRIWNATHRDGRTSFAAKYGYKPQPPKPRGPWAWFRATVNAIPYKVILWGILAINGIVFTLWQSARADAVSAIHASVLRITQLHAAFR